MKKFTVIMLYPDYIANDFGSEHYTSHVNAQDIKEAIAKAQAEASDGNDIPPEDFAVLFVFDGHLENQHAGFC